MLVKYSAVVNSVKAENWTLSLKQFCLSNEKKNKFSKLRVMRNGRLVFFVTGMCPLTSNRAWRVYERPEAD